MKRLTLLLSLITAAGLVQAQKFGSNAIKTGFGIADVEAGSAMGFGWYASLGFQKGLWKNNLRICPNISFGNRSTRSYTDVDDLYFTTGAFNTDVYVTTVRIKSVSVFVGTGFFVSHMSGLRSGRTKNYFSETYAGLNFGAGLRVAPKECRMAFELLPLTFSTGNAGYEMYTSRLQIDIRLNKKPAASPN